MSEQITPAVSLDTIKTRALACGAEFRELQKQGHGIDLRMARLLVEAMDGKYAQALGLKKFEDWLAKYSTADFKTRTAFNLMSVVRGAAQLNVPDEILTQIAGVKLTHIFSLDAAVHGKEMKKMLTKAKNLGSKWTHEQVKAEVDRLKAGGAPTNDEGEPAAAGEGGGAGGEGGDGSSVTTTAESVTLKFKMSKTDAELIAKALKATNQTDQALGLVALANVYLSVVAQAAASPVPLAMAA